MYYREDTHPPGPGWGSSVGSFGSFKGRPKGNTCLIVFACVRLACNSDTWSLWTCIWLPFAGLFANADLLPQYLSRRVL